MHIVFCFIKNSHLRIFLLNSIVNLNIANV